MPNGKIKQKVAESLIMVVDDTAANLQVVGSLLRNSGFRISLISSGAAALKAAEQSSPDLILLDISMPDMNGIEVCKRLKSNALTQAIPIIFLTVHADRDFILEGFASGAVDFVPKPFDSAELLARVRAHLEIKHSRQLLDEQNQALVRLNQEKDEFLGITSHNLKNPLSGVQSLSELLYKVEEMTDEERKEIGKTIFESSSEMAKFILNLLDINRIETQGLKPHLATVELGAMIQTVMGYYKEKSRAKSLKVEFNAHEPLSVITDRSMMEQIVDNLLSNAIKYSPRGKAICINAMKLPNGAVRLEVEDEGPGLSPGDMQLLFGKFARLSAKPTGQENSTGLGLSIVKRLVEALGGNVWCESELGAGARFVVELPQSKHE
jgi:two-component system sensor histidine kinase/response regulator